MKTKAAVAFEAGEPLSIETVAVAGQRGGEVQVKLKAAGICQRAEFTRSGDDPEGLLSAVLCTKALAVLSIPGQHSLLSQKAIN